VPVRNRRKSLVTLPESKWGRTRPTVTILNIMTGNFSVYTSLFNVDNGLFDIDGALTNWSYYAKEILVATIKGQARKTCQVLSDNVSTVKVRVVEVDTDLDDPYFDGKLKNAALQECQYDFVVQQDFDERMGGDKIMWAQLTSSLANNPDKVAAMIPVIDLYKDTEHFKDIGRKWYLHKREGTFRGPVNFAKRADGTIDTNQSDTCELIDERGNLVPFISEERFASPAALGAENEMFSTYAPHVIHLGYLDLEKRVENNKFWGPVWSARNGEKVSVATDIETIEDENVSISHGLGKKWWK